MTKLKQLSDLPITWTKEPSEAHAEREIVTAAIVSTEYLQKILPILRPEYLTAPFAAVVMNWCRGHHAKHGKAPGRNIQSIFEAEREKLNPDLALLVDRFLASISREYEQQEGFSVPYLVDYTRQYFDRRKVELLQDGIDRDMKAGNHQAATARIQAFGENELMELRRDLAPTYTLGGLMDTDFPPIKYAVENLIPEGFNLLSGRMKGGKSHFMYLMSMAIASGQPFMGHYRTEPGRVLYLDQEVSDRMLKNKFKEIMAAQGRQGEYRSWEKNLHLCPRGSWPHMAEGGLKMLAEYIRKRPDLKLIVIDLWGLFKPPRKGKDQFNYDLDYRDVSRVKDIIGPVPLITTHHLNKSWASHDTPFDAIYGSTGLAGAADNLFCITEARGQTNADNLLWGRGKQIDNFKIALEKDVERKDYKYLGDAAVFEMTEDQEAICQALMNAGKPLSPKEIAEVTGKKVRNVSEIVQRMFKAGKLKRPKHGVYVISGDTPMSSEQMILSGVGAPFPVMGEREDIDSPINPIDTIPPITPINPINENGIYREYRENIEGVVIGYAPPPGEGRPPTPVKRD